MITIGKVQNTASEIILGKLITANFNSTADQAIPLLSGFKRITEILIVNWTGVSAVAIGGFYTGTSKSGNAIVGAAQVYTAAGVGIEVLPLVAKSYVTPDTIYLSLTAAEGSALTADVYIIGQLLN